TGIGVPRDKQAAIFRAFEQEDTSTTRRYGGTGLGLTISARLVALMGGHLTVESEPRQGSRFAFTPLSGRRWAAARAPIPATPAGVGALVIDENAPCREVLVRQLRGLGADATAVGDATAALDALGHGVAAGRPFGLVLVDARMPGTDGLAVC